jgi:hypothetical protein
MSESIERGEHVPAPRGDAAWRAAREGVEARNAAAKKIGKEGRDAFERAKEAHRRGVENREMDRFLKSRKTP